MRQALGTQNQTRANWWTLGGRGVETIATGPGFPLVKWGGGVMTSCTPAWVDADAL